MTTTTDRDSLDANFERFERDCAELAEIYTHDLVSPYKFQRARTLIKRIARVTGETIEETIVWATAEAEAL